MKEEKEIKKEELNEESKAQETEQETKEEPKQEAPEEEQKEEAKAEPAKKPKKGIWGHIKAGAQWVYDHRGIVLAGVGFAAGAAVVGTCEYEKGRADQASYMTRNGQQDQQALPDNQAEESSEEIEDAEFHEIETTDESQPE